MTAEWRLFASVTAASLSPKDSGGKTYRQITEPRSFSESNYHRPAIWRRRCACAGSRAAVDGKIKRNYFSSYSYADDVFHRIRAGDLLLWEVVYAPCMPDNGAVLRNRKLFKPAIMQRKNCHCVFLKTGKTSEMDMSRHLWKSAEYNFDKVITAHNCKIPFTNATATILSGETVDALTNAVVHK